ncbi:hypothetical protein STANM309S_03780 [Streptomyces tanashiensis]
MTCAFAAEKKPFSGSVRSDKSTLTLDQSLFLTTVNPIETVTYREPEDDPDEDFAANKAWAGELLEAIDAAHAGLGQHSWSGDATAPVAALRKELATASARWRSWPRRPTRTPTEAYDGAWDALPEDLGADARRALGLTGTPPAGEGTQASRPDRTGTGPGLPRREARPRRVRTGDGGPRRRPVTDRRRGTP